MIDRTHKLPLVHQCQILELARSTAYYQAAPVSPEALALMRRIDELHLNYPFAGVAIEWKGGDATLEMNLFIKSIAPTLLTLSLSGWHGREPFQTHPPTICSIG